MSCQEPTVDQPRRSGQYEALDDVPPLQSVAKQAPVAASNDTFQPRHATAFPEMPFPLRRGVEKNVTPVPLSSSRLLMNSHTP